jgi:hypothetical protein
MQKVNALTGLSVPSSYTLVSEREKPGIIQEITGAKRGKNYWLQDYIKLFK